MFTLLANEIWMIASNGCNGRDQAEGLMARGSTKARGKYILKSRTIKERACFNCLGHLKMDFPNKRLNHKNNKVIKGKQKTSFAL